MRWLLFCLPLAAVFGPPAFVLWLSGELVSPDRVVEAQSRRDRLVIHGPAYTNPNLYVKSRLAARVRPEVLALGTSRVMQFRSQFFRPDVRFYNGGGCARKISQFRAVLEHLAPAVQPAILLISTDPYFFNLKYDPLDKVSFRAGSLDGQFNTFRPPTDIFHTHATRVWKDIRERKINWPNLLRGRGLFDRFGLFAACYEDGFRNDGSYLYAQRERDIHNPTHRDYEFRGTLKEIGIGTGYFPWGGAVSQPALAELAGLLDYCRGRGIEVIGFLPPYPHQTWTAMMDAGRRYDYVRQLESALRPIFAAHGCEFYDFSDFAQLGADDGEAIDGFHGSDKVYLRLFLAMLRQGSALNRYAANLPELESTLATAKDHADVFPNRF